MARRSFTAVSIGAIAAAACTAIAVKAQAGKSVWAGVYTEAQAVAGETLYFEHCVKCHGAELAGVEQAPGLTGSTFAQKWHRAPLLKLFEKVEAMPPTAPKTLTAKQYGELLAFILSANEFPAGTTPLVAERAALAEIVITSTPPK